MLNGKLLGSELKISTPYIPTPAGVVIYSRDYKWLAIAKVSARGVKAAAQSAARYERNLGQVPLTMGQAQPQVKGRLATSYDVLLHLSDLSWTLKGRLLALLCRERVPIPCLKRNMVSLWRQVVLSTT